MRSAGPCAGFVLAELLVVVAIVGVLALLAALEHRRRQPAAWLAQARLQLVGDLRFAGGRALAENRPVVLSVNPAGRTYALWSDLNANGLAETNEVTNGRLTAIPGLALAASGTNGTFLARGGFASSVVPLELRLTIPDAGSNTVLVLPSGRIWWLE